MADGDDFNGKVISEFRANGGKVGGFFEGQPMLLLHHVGAKTGAERVNPLVYQQVGSDYAVFASAAGQPRLAKFQSSCSTRRRNLLPGGHIGPHPDISGSSPKGCGWM